MPFDGVKYKKLCLIAAEANRIEDADIGGGGSIERGTLYSHVYIEPGVKTIKTIVMRFDSTETFLLETLDWNKTNKKAVHRWRARNNINGLVYGNGGLVGWDKETVMNMKTHENAETEESQLDFCWGVPHENLHNCYSSTIINATPQQAFVAGYREGVKMSTEKGKPMTGKNYNKTIWKNNLNILSTWCTIGADIENGKYAMLGARMGCFYTVLEPNNEFFKIRDLDEMEKYFEEVNLDNIDEELMLFGNSLRQQLDIPIAEYCAEDSRFYRFVMPQHKNKGVQDLEYK